MQAHRGKIAKVDASKRGQRTLKRLPDSYFNNNDEMLKSALKESQGKMNWQ
jgi:hypothetical protein